MKWILMIFTLANLLVAAGCASHAQRIEGEPAGGVDHGEHPGDLEHGDTMQK